MVESQHFCLRWNNYQSSITSAFENLRDDEDFVDVTIACEGKSLKAHRVVLSACSPYFRELLKSTPCKHPVIVLQDVAFADLDALVEFIYHGEVNVHQRNLTSFLKTAEVLRVSGLTQQADNREDGLLSQLSSGNPRNICPDPLFNMSPSGRSPPAASSPLHTPPHNNNNNSSSNNNNPVNNNGNSPSGQSSNVGVNHLLRRAAAAAEVSKRLQRNSIPTPPMGNESNEENTAAPMKRPRSINNNSENGPVTNSHGDWDRERDRDRDRDWDRECETDINANPADLTNHQLTPTDFSAKNSFRKNEVERADRERDRDKDRERERSRSPSSRPTEKVKAEPVEVTCGATVELENSGDSVETFNERRHRKQNALVQGPPSTSSVGEHDDLDSSMQSHHNSSFLSAAESKLFAAAGTFNFSMAALAADSALAGMALPGNTEGLAGTSTQEHEGRGCWGDARVTPGQGHGPTGPYCPICRKSFSRAWSLHRHMSDTHFYVPQSFECEVCRRTYRSRNSLVSHKSQYHGGLAGIRAMEEEQRASGAPGLPTSAAAALNNNLPPMADADVVLELVRKQQQHQHHQHQLKSWDRNCTGGLKKVFTCVRCGKMLCSKASLKRHIADKHAQRQEEYRCVVCERVYCSRNSLMTHIYTYHKTRPTPPELDFKFF